MSIEVMQHVGRNLAISPSPLGAGLNIPELTGNKAFPLRSPLGIQTWHQTFADNWDQFFTGPSTMASSCLGLPSAQQLAIRAAWCESKVIRSPDKSVEGAVVSKTLGVEWDGLNGHIGPDAERLLNLILMALMGLAQERLSVLFLEEFAGLCAFCFEYQRPLFCLLTNVFHWIALPRSAEPHPELLDELVLVACMACTSYTDLRSGIDPEPITTDASETGGGACVGSFISPEWYDFGLRTLSLPQQGLQFKELGQNLVSGSVRSLVIFRIYLLSLTTLSFCPCLMALEVLFKQSDC